MYEPHTDSNPGRIPRFVASKYGRAARVGLGTTLIASGLAVISWPAGLAVAAFGLVPLITGMLNLCPIAPAWGGHFRGARYCNVPANAPANTNEGKV